METRRIVKSGNTSYILALPIGWVRRYNLERNRLVQISENEQGDLVVSAEGAKVASREEFVTIKVDGKDDKTIGLEFLSAYVRDANSIIFEGKEIFQKKSKILENVKFFIGLDVIEQSTTSITVKNFFTLDNETSPYILLKKMDIVNRAGFDLLRNFSRKSFANEDLFELQKLKEQNERLFVLIRKSILKLFENPGLMKKVQTNYLQIAKEKIFAQSLINISHSLLSLGKSFLLLDRTRNEVKKLQQIVLTAYEEYLNLLNAVNNKSYDGVNSFLKKSPFFLEEIDKFQKTLDDPLMTQATSFLPHIYNNLQIIAYETLT